MLDAGYATPQDPRLQPPAEPPEKPVDVMDGCAHAAACQRVWTEHVDAREFAGWEEEMARLLCCDTCELWEEG